MNERWSIVVIDDEEDIRDVLSVALADAGFDVRTAPDGKTGLDLCLQCKPQIVITDVRMPAMDGIEVLRRLKERLPDTEVVVMTAFGEMDLAIEALRLDASDFITKPISNDNLLMATERARQRYVTRLELKQYTALLEKEKAETSQQLLKTLHFQHHLIDSSMDGICAADKDDSIVIFNPAMEQLLGWSQEDVVRKKNLADLFSENDYRTFHSTLASDRYGGPGRLFLFETHLVTRQGKHLPAQVSASTFSTEDGERGMVCFFRDLRQIRRLEREIEDQARVLHQDKMMSLGRLAASVVHEINNPLSGILNYARLMIRILDNGRFTDERRDKFRHYLSIVETETDRCSRIVSNLLSFSRRSPERFGPVDVKELIGRSILLCKHKIDLSHIVLEQHIAPDVATVIGDANQLQQCLINLFFNAIDAMEQGGRLTVKAGCDNQRQAVVIRVEDTGPGIDPDHLEEIFEPFFTTKKEGHGLGLGLSTVYGIVQRHGGSIEAFNAPNGGATFVLTLPAADNSGYHRGDQAK